MNAVMVMACEYFFYPPLRQYFRRLFFENARYSTKALNQETSGPTGLHIYHPAYVFKRIKNRPISKLKGNVFILLDLLDSSFLVGLIANA
jgi:hypothetical protein